ncbi:MAG: sugar ABC transporter permease [Clostridia bacterium]|nr:sugar ABC transporter permease [Clostridia bacterium]MBR2883591.1 sugar ABC transporter permease [Clostridia bacterium]
MQKIKKQSDIYKESWFTTVSKDFKRNRTIYLLLIPVLLYYIMFHYAPMYGSVIAFQNFKPQKGILGSDFVGLMHFKNFFNSPFFGRVLLNTLRISFSSIIFGFPAPILLALLLNELKFPRFAKVVQNITYMPHFISLVVICSLIREFTLDTGVINYILGFFGFEATSLLNFPQYFTTVYVASGIWQEIGWGSIIYLAALSGLDPALYEAATIDGANRFDQMLHVTLPGILPTIVIMLILKLGQVLSVGYEKIILLYNDNTMSVADVISTYVYAKGLLDLDWSFSSAVGLFNSIINFLFLNVANFISKKTSEYSLW